MLPKRKARIDCRKSRARAISVSETAVMTYKSCLAAEQARSRSLRPRYWDTTTAPPVPRAAKTWISSRLMLSTRDIPETAASPAVVTMTVSAMPTVISKSCSMTRGMMSRLSSPPVKSGLTGCDSLISSMPFLDPPQDFFTISIYCTIGHGNCKQELTQKA